MNQKKNLGFGLRLVGHVKNILVHKKWVFYYCCKLGIPYRGLVHDLSKFSPTEFFESVKYFQGSSSPIPACKKENGYSKAWQHHKGRNKHHYEYWTDNYDSGTTCIKIPYTYVLEMIADWLAAGRTYQGDKFTMQSEMKWWMEKKKVAKIHPDTKKLISNLLFMLCIEDGFKLIRNNKKEITLYYDRNLFHDC